MREDDGMASKTEPSKAGSRALPAVAKGAPAKAGAPSTTKSPGSTSSPPAARRAAMRAPVKQLDREKGKGRKLTDAEIKKAAAEGRKIVGYGPAELEEFLRGHRTLGELEGISKKEQYRMADVGYRFLTEGKLEQGKQVFFGLVALDPYDAYFITCLASAHQQSKEVAEAERLYSRALEINPYQTTARAHRGELRAMAGRLQEAVDDLTRAVKDDPEGKDPAVKRAAVLLKAIQLQLQ